MYESIWTNQSPNRHRGLGQSWQMWFYQNQCGVVRQGLSRPTCDSWTRTTSLQSLWCSAAGECSSSKQICRQLNTGGDSTLKNFWTVITAKAIQLCVICTEVDAEAVWMKQSSEISGVLQSRNMIGPRTEPCGTPHVTLDGLERERPCWTDWVRLDLLR